MRNAPLTVSGPLSPKGRRRMSTRNALPSAVRSPSRRITSRPRRVKKSSLSMQRAPEVVPLSGNTKMRSMSDEKLSSHPPSLPMPSTMKGCATPATLRGSPYMRARSWPAYSTAASMAASANALVSASVSESGAQPARSRQAIRTISRSRWRRRAAMNPARSGSPDTAAFKRSDISPRAKTRVSAASSINHRDKAQFASAESRPSAAQTKSLAASTRGNASRNSGAADSNTASAPDSRTRVSCCSQ